MSTASVPTRYADNVPTHRLHAALLIANGYDLGKYTVSQLTLALQQPQGQLSSCRRCDSSLADRCDATEYVPKERYGGDLASFGRLL